MISFSRTVFAVLLLAVFSSCSAADEGESFEWREITIESQAGTINLLVELAVTTAQHRQGLMHREVLDDGKGMLFIFEIDQILSFWMKNTLIPLSIAYIASNGRIIEIHNLEPGNLNPVRSSRSARYALEVQQNWFERAGITPGDMVNIRF